jgi:hypothetical protein
VGTTWPQTERATKTTVEVTQAETVPAETDDSDSDTGPDEIEIKAYYML